MFSKITMATRMGAEPWNRRREKGLSLVWIVLSLAIPTPQPQTKTGGWNQKSSSSEHEALQKSDLRRRPPLDSRSAVTAPSTLAAALPSGAPGLSSRKHPTPSSVQLGLQTLPLDFRRSPPRVAPKFSLGPPNRQWENL